jgi:hypothetical protein
LWHNAFPARSLVVRECASEPFPRNDFFSRTESKQDRGERALGKKQREDWHISC